MLEKFQKYIHKHKIVTQEDAIVIAVSGGIDSVVLCHLFDRCGVDFAVAHCNFRLRGNESDEDEAFVEKLAIAHKVQNYKIAFDTKSISLKEKSSTQIIARRLRYEWFQKLCAEHGFNKIATAHHMNDRIETFLYNFTKGTGIRGLRNMTPETGNIIRPLLFASKSEIIDYAQKHNLSYREDASNSSTKYNRNKLRLEVVPVLKNINPALEKTSLDTFKNLEDTEALFQWAIEEHRGKLLSEKDGIFYIDFEKLKETVAPQAILFELITPFGFSSEQVKNMLDEQTRDSGAQFVSTAHRLIINRNQLIITTSETNTFSPILIQSSDHFVNFKNQTLTITKHIDPPFDIPTSPDTIWLDAEKVQFPMELRQWQPGDYFHPIGMKGRKQKVKKYLTNEKLSLAEKENVFVLLSNNDICWIIGRRMDERFRIGNDTTKVIALTIR